MKYEFFRTFAMLGFALAAPAFAQTAAPAAGIAQLKYKVGQRVEYIDNGKWYKAVIVNVRDDRADHLDNKLYAPYRVHPIGYNDLTDSWVCCAADGDFRTQLRPAGSGPTEPVPGGEANDAVLIKMSGIAPATPTQPAAKLYNCVPGASFSITGKNSYTDSEGVRGTYSFSPASLTVSFRGGNYDGQRAVYETSGGLPRLHILGPSGRPVIDCD